MRVKIGEIEYSVSWTHYNNHIEGRNKKGSQTLCNIVFPNGEVYSGIARCSKRDNFCKDTGRRISLERALTIFNDKRVRRIFWKTYFSRGILIDNYIPVMQKKNEVSK